MPATGNIAPKLLVAIYESFIKGDQAASLSAQRQLNPVRLALTLGTAPGGVKGRCSFWGCRLARAVRRSAPLPPDKVQKMKAALQSAGLLP